MLAGIREWRNSFIPINRVPLDVLSLIPTHLDSQRDRFLATFVCRHWRRTFLQHGVLWAQLLLKRGEAYAKTLLARAKGSSLDISTSCNDPAGALEALYPYTQQIRSINFTFSFWEDIQRFSEANSGALPLLSSLTINVWDEFSLDHPDRMTPPSLPLFSNAVNVKDFTLRSERFPFLAHFTLPNLTTFSLLATPALKSEAGYHALELLDFLEASPTLRTVSIKIIAGMIRLHNIPPERVVVLPNVNAFSMAVDDGGSGYQLATHISCPSVKCTSLAHESFDNNVLPPVIFPPPPSWNVISRQYTTIPIDEAILEMSPDGDPIISCSLAFRSRGAAVLALEFKLLKTEDSDEDDDRIPYQDLHLATFRQATAIIRDHPFLPNVRRLLIRHRCSANGFDQHRYLASQFGGLLKSVGPLNVLEVHHCDLHVYLAPFLYLQEFNNMEEPIVYPPIKELKIYHPSRSSSYYQEECMTAIVEFARSQHARGIPFERVEFCMEKLPTGIVERLRPYVGTLDCYEEPNPEYF
jgi:hypothetical protein